MSDHCQKGWGLGWGWGVLVIYHSEVSLQCVTQLGCLWSVRRLAIWVRDIRSFLSQESLGSPVMLGACSGKDATLDLHRLLQKGENLRPGQSPHSWVSSETRLGLSSLRRG